MAVHESILVFAGALAILVKASDITVDRAIHLARLTGISQLAVGAIVLSLGTSLPELAISLISSLAGEPQIAFGMLVGASIADITLVMGLTALAGTVYFKKRDIERLWIIVLSSGVALLALVRGAADGAVGVAAILAYIFFTNYTLSRGYRIHNIRHHRIFRKSLAKDLLILTVAVAFVVISARLITSSVAFMAGLYGIHEAVIGAAIIGIGTTLPELSVSVAAIRKRNSTLAAGNLVGSLITNLGLILGLGAIAAPVAINSLERFMLVSYMAIAVLFHTIVATRMKINRIEGMLMIAIFAAFELMVLASP